MTFAEYVLAVIGKERQFYSDFSKHRLTAYQVYLSIPEGKGKNKKPIWQFFPLPTDENSSYDFDKLMKVREEALKQIRAKKTVN